MISAARNLNSGQLWSRSLEVIKTNQKTTIANKITKITEKKNDTWEYNYMILELAVLFLLQQSSAVPMRWGSAITGIYFRVVMSPWITR